MMVAAVRVISVLVMVGMIAGGSRRMHVDEVAALRRGQMPFQPRYYFRQARRIF